MHLDYLHNTNAFGDHIVRLYNFGMEEAVMLRNAIVTHIIEKNESLDLSALNFVVPRNCHLVLHITHEDAGILTNDGKHFICALTLDGYKNMVLQLEPYCTRHTTGFKYLYDLDTEIDFLLSPAGTW
jgi:hypothetical protein